MKIVCATSVTLGQEAFSTIGRVEWIPERDIGPAAVRDADLLITRSKVKLNRALLENSAVKFVATATAGMDHLDIPFLNSSRIAWTSAPGCNANSVAEWVVAALLHLATKHNVQLEGGALGIIGVGHVGSRVAALAPALGLHILLNDPPRALAQPGPQWHKLETVLADADILALHVPLVDGNPFPTREMANGQFFSKAKRDLVLLNASRGEVLNEDALLIARRNGRIRHAALDVFADEPDVDPLMADAADLVTPHIAGYSYEGRVRGTEMCYLAACSYLRVRPTWSPPPLPADPAREIVVDPTHHTIAENLASAVRAAYDIAEDDRALRDGLSPFAADRRKHFQSLRMHYRDRHEFPAFTIHLQTPAPELARRLTQLGFVVKNV